MELKKYQRLLVSRPQLIGQLESTLKSVALFIPGKFRSSRFTSQLLLSLLRSISIVNDSILLKVVKSSQSAHTRYTRYWLKNHYYHKFAWLLTAIQIWETTIEMLVVRLNQLKPQKVPDIIVVIESLKAALRMAMLYISRRQVLSSVLPMRDYNLATVQVIQPWTGKRLKKEYPRIQDVDPEDLFKKVTVY